MKEENFPNMERDETKIHEVFSTKNQHKIVHYSKDVRHKRNKKNEMLQGGPSRRLSRPAGKAKMDDLRSIPGTHVMKERNNS